ncbi:C1 family peptidase [Roseivirga sp.]|uniref:C1 family peptidase n=1 Tax=Roseivirga sp. TaxID=1964215 RepID=UPI002B267D1C|nr:C1 family peptidase [Roseivirga sp.]
MKTLFNSTLCFIGLLLFGLIHPSNAQELKIDYRAYQSPVKDQGYRGTCTAFAVAAALEVLPGAPKDISEKYIYAIRKMVEWDMGEGKVSAGDFVKNYALGLAKYGVLNEYELPYSPMYTEWSDFDANLRKVILEGDIGPVSLMAQYVPRAQTFVSESQVKIFNGTEMRNIDLIRQLLLQGHKAIPVGYTVYAPQWKDHSGKPADRLSLEGSGFAIKGLNSNITMAAAKLLYGDNLIPKIAKGELKVVRADTNPKAYGGHEVVIVGFDKDGFILKNSWGTDWGDGGYFYVSNEFHQLFVNEMAVFYGVTSK